MITWEEALKTASGRLKEIGSCTEFTTAYVFRGPEKEETIGGFAAPVVVMKEIGRRCSFDAYITEYGGGERIREIRLRNEGAEKRKG